MPLIIRTTGLEDYAPGGEARIKVLIIGGPGAGKTRYSSYFPKPIFADCEKGRASLADREMPYVEILNSTDMLDLLAMLKQEGRQPVAQRRFQTVVIDTLDAFQRKVKDEWMEKNNASSFTGWDAWGYLNSRMQTLMTRLLNLDMNVIVNVHYKTKKSKDADGQDSSEIMLQLQGDAADTAFNDFDLVGWMGTYWEAVDGQRVEKRGLTFRKTPDKPFLKDRLHVTPPWMEVMFADADYTNLFEAIQSRVKDLKDGSVIGEVPPEDPKPVSQMVVAPGAIGTGPVAPTAPVSQPISQLDKPTLAKMARDKGITTTVDGVPIKGNTLKSELIAALEAHANAPTPVPVAETPAPAGPIPAPENPQPPTSEPVARKDERGPGRNQVATEAGTVDARTGEVVDDMEPAITVIEEQLGGVVLAQGPPPTPPPGPTGAAAPVVEAVCEVCQKPLAGENQDKVKLAWIKYRKMLCNDDFAAKKTGR
jgi:hypothetical protein